MEFVGHVTDVANLWRRHHAALLPSRGGEGVPKSLIEAAACGRPIITSSVPGCRDLAEATGGWTAAAEDVKGFARILLRLADDPQLLYERIARTKEVIVDHYSEAAVWAKVNRFYLDLINGHSPSRRDQISAENSR